MNATDITATVTPSAVDFDDWNWAEEAIAAWKLAAQAHGVAVQGEIDEPVDGRYDRFAGRVQVDGKWYTLTVSDDYEVTAEMDGE